MVLPIQVGVSIVYGVVSFPKLVVGSNLVVDTLTVATNHLVG